MSETNLSMVAKSLPWASQIADSENKNKSLISVIKQNDALFFKV